MIISTILAASFLLSSADPPLVADKPIAVPGAAGHFDFMNVDVKNRLVFACHPGNKSLAVVDMDSGKTTDVDCKVAVNGMAADTDGHRAFAAGPGNTLVCIDTKTWQVTATLPLSGPGDCVQYDAKRGVVYVDNDDGTNLWVVDAATMKLQSTIEIHEAPEYMEYDRTRDKIFQAIKSTSEVQVIDMKTLKVTDSWKLGELTGPHGLCLDRKAGRVYVVGSNGKMVTLDADSGKIVNTFDVTKGSDQVAMDIKMKRIYIPAGGKLQVINVEGDTPKVLAELPISTDCKRVTVDTKNHDVWIAFQDKTNSFFQKFIAK
jgi:DNA-binding beta-propeller fold protein YncE